MGHLASVDANAWHAGQMSKEIDPARARSALAVVKQHPGMVLFVASPGIIAIGVIWALAGPGWAALLLVALIVGGGLALVRKLR
jgi:hypothetical protein